MVTHDILRHLKGEIEFRKDQIVGGFSCPSSELPAQYNYKVGFLHALMQMQEWVKDWEVKKLRADLEE